MGDVLSGVRLADRWSYLYAEHTSVERDAGGVVLNSKDGSLVTIPVAQLALLMLGPGTRVTHAAIDLLARHGCLVAWVGEEGVRMYAFGSGGSRPAERVLLQARLTSEAAGQARIAGRMFARRFGIEPSPSATVEELRGREGIAVRREYERLAAAHGVEWAGREVSRTGGAWPADAVNRALSTAHSCLYGICHAGVLALGLSPALGFVHRGSELSFVYDVADLYKLELAAPVAFAEAVQGEAGLERRVRTAMRDRLRETRFLGRFVEDVLGLFAGEAGGGDGPLQGAVERTSEEGDTP